MSGAFSPGARVGDYRIVRKLGQGGMGAAFLVEREDTGAGDALKVLIEGTADAAAAARFVREGEAQAAAQGHPNVLRVRAAGVHAGSPWLLVDFAPGGSLGDKLREGPLSVAEAGRVVLALARAVEHVHARGVLHRDLKPDNVLFDESGTPLLVDFGLARVEDSQALTKTGAMLGTPGYMAPEQTETSRATVDERTDVYGLGAVLYACLTARAPFVGPDPMNVVVQVLREPVEAPSKLRADVPAALDALCVRALAKKPADRPASAADFARALEAALDARRGPVRPRALLAGLAVGCLVALVALVVALSMWRPPPPPPSPPTGTAVASEADPGGPVSVTLEGPENTHRARERLVVTLSTRARTVEVHVGPRRSDLRPGGLVSGVEVDLEPGENVVRVSVPGRGEAERRVRRFLVPGDLVPGEAPGEVVAKDGSILVYHPPGKFLMGWNAVVSSATPTKNAQQAAILAENNEAAAREPPTEADRRERAVVLRWKDQDETEDAALFSSLKNESPRHEEVLSEGFFLGKHEVTWDLYRRHRPEHAPKSPSMRGVEPDPRHPVFDVTWDEAKSYCEAYGLRLPSEVEWEYAARGGELRRLFPWGDDAPEDGRDRANVGGDADGCPGLAPVGSFPLGASRWGCLDLAGNVYEWTGDRKYRYRRGRGLDPRANTHPERMLQSAESLNLIETVEGDGDVIRMHQRGGAWDREMGRARSGFRVSALRTDYEERTGFRVAHDARSR